MESVLVAFSGGVDSALVLLAAHEVLGDKVTALTAISPSFPPEEQQEARLLAGKLGVRHLLVDSHELENEGYAQNLGNRCYFCKDELFHIAQKTAEKESIKWVVDGTILDDLGDHRPGLQAAKENRVRHPLVEAGLDKLAVRRFAKAHGLTIWDKPSFACLGSRFPVGTRVTLERLRQVEKVESFLRIAGLRQFRARWHQLEGQTMIRIELDQEDMNILTQGFLREALVELCHAEGVRWVTLDLMGYQKGGLSRANTPAVHAPIMKVANK